MAKHGWAVRGRTAVLRGVAAALLSVTVVALGGCSGEDPGKGDGGATPQEVLADAKATLDATSGLTLTLSTDDLPSGVAGLTAAKGVATSAPAFDGSISIVFAGNDVPVPVIAVDGKVYAQIPLTVGWSEVDPADYGAPDPAQLVSKDHGFSSLLPATTDLAKGSSKRGGTDNNEILTEYTGTVPGSAMKQVIPSSSGDSFDATYLVTDDGELRQAVLTGVFYPDSDSMTYTVIFDDYGKTAEITAP